ALREALEVAALRGQVEPRVGDDRNADRLVPVARVEGDDGGPLGEGHDTRPRRRQCARMVGDSQDVELARSRAEDRLDLEESAGRAQLEELPLEEAVVEPARPVGARQRAGPRVAGD